MIVRRDMRYPRGGLMAAPLSIALADAGGVRAVRVRGGETPGHAGRQLSFGGSAAVVDADDPRRILARACS